MKKNNWYIITGGPSSGKSTLIKELEKLGYKTIPEIARVVIDEGRALGKSVEEIRKDEKQFQYEVLKRKVEIEKILDKNESIFFDRAIHDSHAYLEAYKYEIDDAAKKLFRESKYSMVFLLAPLKSFEKDYARTEDQDFAKRIVKLLNVAYKKAGMNPIWVPDMPPKKRIKFVLKQLEKAKD